MEGKNSMQEIHHPKGMREIRLRPGIILFTVHTSFHSFHPDCFGELVWTSPFLLYFLFLLGQSSSFPATRVSHPHHDPAAVPLLVSVPSPRTSPFRSLHIKALPLLGVSNLPTKYLLPSLNSGALSLVSVCDLSLYLLYNVP